MNVLNSRTLSEFHDYINTTFKTKRIIVTFKKDFGYDIHVRLEIIA